MSFSKFVLFRSLSLSVFDIFQHSKQKGASLETVILNINTFIFSSTRTMRWMKYRCIQQMTYEIIRTVEHQYPIRWYTNTKDFIHSMKLVFWNAKSLSAMRFYGFILTYILISAHFAVDSFSMFICICVRSFFFSFCERSIFFYIIYFSKMITSHHLELNCVWFVWLCCFDENIPLTVNVSRNCVFSSSSWYDTIRYQLWWIQTFFRFRHFFHTSRFKPNKQNQQTNKHWQ